MRPAGHPSLKGKTAPANHKGLQPCSPMSENVVAQYDMDTPVIGELTIRKGDTISISNKGKDSGWWEGVNLRTGQPGVFPNCFVTIESHHHRPAQDFVNAALVVQPFEQFEVGDLLTIVGKRGDAFLGICHAKNLRTLSVPPTHVVCNLAKVEHDFVARHKYELTVKRGDIVRVERKWNDGWWEGTLVSLTQPKSEASSAPQRQATGAKGLFPHNYTTPNHTDHEFFCNSCFDVLVGGVCAGCQQQEVDAAKMFENLEQWYNRTNGVCEDGMDLPELFAGVAMGELGPPPPHTSLDGTACFLTPVNVV
eukprot:TRINITY_DN61205_c0_g1_i1.p1 TRINITY_DN61205_c0_g1~~TRINITY_DN61205_c0_g1_i1.p1  ORF type:complete len:308 (-),score=26.38 TRINITY_DN61205_c0_g1_i1:234-1157(-)